MRNFTKNIGDHEEKNSFERTEDKGYFHTDNKKLHEMLTQMYTLTADTEPAGNWSFIGDSFAALISFAPDGSFDYVLKPKAKPIIVLSSVWGIDADRNKQVLVERFGNGTMPLEYTFRWQSKQNGLLIESLYDSYMLPHEGESVFFAEKPDEVLVLSANNLYH